MTERALKFEISRRGAATTLAAAALAGFTGEAAAQPVESASSGVKIERLADSAEAQDPYQVAAEALESMNSVDMGDEMPHAHPNFVWGGAILVGPGTLINNAPIAAAERSKAKVPGRWRVPKGQSYLIQLPRLYRSDTDKRTWALGYLNDGSGVDSAVNTQNTKWIDLKTAHYKTYAYPSDIHRGKAIAPSLLATKVDSDSNLKLMVPFNTPKGILTPVLEIMAQFKKPSYVQPNLNYIGLKPTKIKPHL